MDDIGHIQKDIWMNEWRKSQTSLTVRGMKNLKEPEVMPYVTRLRSSGEPARSKPANVARPLFIKNKELPTKILYIP